MKFQIWNTEYTATMEKTIMNESLPALNKLKLQLQTNGFLPANHLTERLYNKASRSLDTKLHST